MHTFSENAQIIVDEVKASLHRDINFMNEEGVIIASTNPARLGVLHRGARRVLREGLEQLVVTEATDDGMLPGINLPIQMGGQKIGVIGITGDPAEVSAFGGVIQKMTEIMLEYIEKKEEESVLDDARLQFIEHWLFSEKIDLRELEVRGTFFGLDITAPWVVFFLNLLPREEDSGRLPALTDNPELKHSHYLRSIRDVLGDTPQSFCFSYGSGIVILLQTGHTDTAAGLINRVRQELMASFGVVVSGGISSAAKAPLDIRRCFREAQTAAYVAREGHRERIVRYDETSLEFIARSIDPSIGRNLADIVFFSCQPEEITEFVETIRLYFAEKGNLERMAEALYVHCNTVQYRIQKMQKRTGYDLRTPRDACILYFASVLYRFPA